MNKNKFDAKRQTDRIVSWIREWFRVNGPDCNAIIGISGGKDSLVATALCVEALGVRRVIGILMPNGVQPDIDYAYDAVEHLGIRSYTVNIKDVVDNIQNSLAGDLGKEPSAQTKTNLPARIRMATLYAYSQSLNGRVVNTCNLSEDYVGYSTKYGDAAGDFAPLKPYTSEEVILIGMELGLPLRLLSKAPADGLCGKTDEDNLGFSYEVLNRYIRTGEIQDAEAKKKIDRLHAINAFKELPIESMYYDPSIMMGSEKS